ncbi:IclR family transcriptional regulator domain-containing protein [Flavimaribacter sediminis]|uniref:IclR family transcriptional regulator domain-containing protein n=1 Tax=Flavimaribacter sediminis TaxID=2865987 RepID=UPI00351F2771
MRKRFPDQTWKKFKQDLRAIRKDGYSFTTSEVSEDQTGLAAPGFRGDTVIASVSIVMAKPIFDELETRLCVQDAVKSCARDRGNQITDTGLAPPTIGAIPDKR